jgi:hypothetical protein
MKNKILAIPAAVPATPPKPSTAAMSAITRNVTVHPNIVCLLMSSLLFSIFLNAPIAIAISGASVYCCIGKFHAMKMN